MSRSSLAQTAALLLVVALGVAAWGVGVTHRFFDYDEIYHAHATWLIARGSTPFHDFQGSHPPFLWYALALVWRTFPNSPSTLLPLRVVAAVGTLLSVAGMTACVAAARREVPVAWLTAGVAAIAFDVAILDYGIEFRPDSWATACLFLGFFLCLTHRPASIRRRCAVFGIVSSLAVLASPKFFLLPVLFATIDSLDRVRRRDDPVGAMLGYLSGAAAALLLALVFLRVAGIDPVLAFNMAIRYQWGLAWNGSFRHGLVAGVMTYPHLLMFVVAGVLAWCAYLATERRRPSTYETAVLLFLVVQLAIVNWPYKQYYAPWFLLAASFVGFVGVYVDRMRPRAAPWLFALAILLCGWVASKALVAFTRHNQAAPMLAFYETMVRLTPDSARIVAYPPLHPIIRRDVFYGWSRTTDPGGHGTEAVMRALALPVYSERFDRPHYRQELESSPPALVVSPLDDNWGYEPAQWAVLGEYLAAHRESYALIDRGLLRPMWIRRDSLDPSLLEQFTGASK